VVLVSLAAAAVASMQIGGRLADSQGARSVALPASALLVCGVMSRLHASFSIGNLIAAGGVLLVSRLAGDGARVITPALVTLSEVSVVALLVMSHLESRPDWARSLTGRGSAACNHSQPVDAFRHSPCCSGP
jgi:hypothetical protein